MKRFIRALLPVAFAIWPICAPASPLQLSDLFVFGDSLSDSGNSALLSRAATGGAAVIPPPPYLDGRFSNGPVAVEYLWDLYHPGDRSFGASLTGGTNYAIGGATTGEQNYGSVNPALAPPNAGADLRSIFDQRGAAWQLERFAARDSGFDPETSLFVVWLFPNDLFYFDVTGDLPGTVPLSPGGSDLIANGIANILAIIQTLADAGARHFLVPNLVDLGSTPEFLGNAALTGLANAFNANLAAALSGLDAALLSAEIVEFDVNTALKEIIADPAAYGLSVTDQSCTQGSAIKPECDPDTWVFWDGIHPTTRVHEILARQFRAALPEPTTIALVLLGLIGMQIAAQGQRH